MISSNGFPVSASTVDSSDSFSEGSKQGETMSDPFYLADILLGRVGVLRSTAESIILELCEAQAKLEAGTAAGALPAATSDEDALRLAIKSKLERVQTNLKLLRKLVPEFGSVLSSLALGVGRR